MKNLIETVINFYNKNNPHEKLEVYDHWRTGESHREYIITIHNKKRDVLLCTRRLLNHVDGETEENAEHIAWSRTIQSILVAGISKINEVTLPRQSYGDHMKSNPKKPERCPLTDDRLVEAVEQWNQRMCKSGGKDWMLTIPADVNRDPDILIDELCKRFKEKTNPHSEGIGEKK